MSVATQVTREIGEPDSSFDGRSTVERLRLGLVCLVLTLAVFAQSAGSAATDTKFDLVVSPLRFLGRALRLWDPIGNAGQLQNQAYGYLFPMGPFFAGLHSLGFAAWELQRAWEAAIVVAAFLGAYRCARRLGVGAFWPAVAAGLVYALAPRTLGELTSISSELMPVAALPWVLLPLIGAASAGSPRRAAARSGVALLFAGGVNAAASLAILPVPALWLLTRSRGPRRRALMGWWVLAVLLACTWWLLPLVQLGRYSPPFLDWIESASTTTLPTSLLATLRGVDHWESYLGPSVWPAGWILASAPAAIAATTAVAAAGLVGISRRDVGHRVFLWLSLLLGLVLITAGHAAPVGPPGAGTVRTLLDGVLVPFRNVHKFDPLVRFPLSIGVGLLIQRVRVPRQVSFRRGQGLASVPLRAMVALGAVAVGCVAVSPVFTNHLVSSQRITPEPSWWSAAGKWLAANSGRARALVVPGSASPSYLWGGTVDNALQPVATTPWTVRDSVPLTQPGYIRLLNAIEDRLSAGAGDPDLAALLARAGIGYVVIANDLNTLASQSTPLLFVRSTLDASPGITLRASIGPDVGGSLSTSVLLDAGATQSHPAVQIYGVDRWQGMVGLQSLTGAAVASGSADSLPALLSRGLPQSTPVLFGHDADGVPVTGPVSVTTDGLRKREASFAAQLTASATMTAAQPYTFVRPVHDYLPERPGPLSALRYLGIADVRASTSGADLLAYVNRSDLNGPWSALDADASTAWRSSGFGGALGQWLQVDFAGPVTLSPAELTFADATGGLPVRLDVGTDAGTVRVPVRPTTDPQTLALPQVTTRHLRLTVAAVDGGGFGGGVGIAMLRIPGVDPARTLQVAGPATPDLLAFDAATGYRSTCLDVLGQAYCDPHYARAGQEDAALDRTFTLGGSGQYVPAATVRFTGGATVDGLLDRGSDITATATSTNSADPRQRAGAAVDGDPWTAWQAAPGDTTPALTLRLPQARQISGLTLATPVTAPVAAPVSVTVTAGDQQWSGQLPDDGHITFARPALTSTVTVRIDETGLRVSTDTPGLTTRLLPVGIAEIRLDGAPQPPPADGPVAVGCDAGLALEVDGRAIALRVDAARSDVLAGRPVAAQPCDSESVPLGTGEHRVSLAAVPGVAPVSVTLGRETGPSLALSHPAGTSAVRQWSATTRRVEVDTTDAALLVVHENLNAGWRASVGGRSLRPVRVDGWQQGFVVPAGTRGTVELTYAPQRRFAVGLIVGLLAALCVVALAMVGRGRADHPPVHDGRPRPLCVALVVLVTVVALSGWPGLLVAAVSGALAATLAVARYPLPSWLCGAVLLVGGILVALAERPTIFTEQNSGLTQLVCVAALVTGALSCFAPPRQGRVP